MKLDFDKEMDSLLRNHPQAARKRGAMADAVPGFARRDADETQRAATAHLDADELSAYAENALPAATRGRYISHLADCEMCRKHATSIAMAADVAGALERSDAAERTPADANASPSTWRAWLASFFSPRALRYAMPVLALIVTGTMLLMTTLVYQRAMKPPASRVAMREAPREDALSYEERASSEEADNQAGQAVMSEPTPAAVNQEAPQASGAADSSRQTGEPKKTEAFARASKDEAALTDAPAASGVAGTSVSQPAAPQRAATSTVETRQPQSAAEVESLRVEGRSVAPSTATPPAKEITKAADKDEERERKVEDVAVIGGNKVVNAPPAVKRKQSSAPRDELAATEKQNRKAEEVVTVTRPAAPRARPEGETSGAKARSRRSDGRTMNDSVSESSVETRRVAGRQFRRQGGGAWVDTEYKSSASLTNVTRGSEQYRALTADEPELRRIAEQLGGEVIVVWKNRAYRIR
ncbi:MAG: hypothetical protein M3430_02340 [Acidobacteriota bacterium]|nr:hypothetical protein [Acidobacteriota bacterium]